MNNFDKLPTVGETEPAQIQAEDTVRRLEIAESIDPTPPTPDEAYERNMEQTLKDVRAALQAFDVDKLKADYQKKTASAPADAPLYGEPQVTLLDFAHTQKFEVSGKLVTVAAEFSSADDAYIVHNNLTVVVEGQRYEFSFRYAFDDSNSSSQTALAVRSKVLASGQEAEVSSYSVGERLSAQHVDGGTYLEPGEHHYGELSPEEQALMQEMGALLARLDQMVSPE